MSDVSISGGCRQPFTKRSAIRRGLLLFVTLACISGCQKNTACTQGSTGGEKIRWIHKGAKVIRDIAAQLPKDTDGGNHVVTITILPCDTASFNPTDGAAVADAINKMNSQLPLYGQPSDTVETPANCKAGDHIRINDTASGNAYLFRSSGKRDVFYMLGNTADSTSGAVDFWPQQAQ